MNTNQEQSDFDILEKFIKTEPVSDSGRTKQNKDCPRKPEIDTTVEKFVIVDEIKVEYIEWKMSTVEQRSDLPIKMEQDALFENVQIFRETIQQELENISDIKVRDINQEVGDIQSNAETEVCDLLASYCDLPNMEIESTSCLSKPLKNTAQVILKKNRRIYACPICQKNFRSSKSRSTHIDDHFGKCYAVCQFCGKLITKIEIFQHYFIHIVKNRTKRHGNDNTLKCNLSSKYLARKSIDNVVHKSIKCGTCFKDFNDRSNLQKHLIIHGSQKPFKCKICSKGFTRNFDLQRHSVIHSGVKRFKCDICSYEFALKHNLQSHLISHSGEKPFKCDTCSKKFTRKSDLKRHIIINNTEKRFKCDICFNEFTQKHNLHQHLIIHSGEKPFKCDICSKEFARKSDLQRHLIMHSGEKPFKCVICYKGFSQKCHLQGHLICHSGEKQFKCDICSKEFARKPDLQRHLLIHINK